MQFDWDSDKAVENVEKHQGVTFEEAQTVFADSLSRILLDPEHSAGEGRYLEIGYSNRNRLLIVC